MEMNQSKIKVDNLPSETQQAILKVLQSGCEATVKIEQNHITVIEISRKLRNKSSVAMRD